MASLDPILTILEQSQVSPPPATVSTTSLPLTFFDIFYLSVPPIHFLFFYDLPLSRFEFTETIIPKLKHSLSITLQHFFPYAGNLIVFPNRTSKPEIRYVEGDSVNVTFGESNLDYHDLTGYHPRNSEKFYHLIPLLGDCPKISDFVKIPGFSLQVTNFPNCGIAIGMSIHHSLADGRTQSRFMKAWSSITRCGTDESFLANETLPIYERLIKYPERDETFLDRTKLETFNEDYKLPTLSGPVDKVRATFVLKRTFLNELKTRVMSKLPTLPYASSFTAACAYIWCCLAQARKDELEAFIIPIDCRTRLDPPIPAAYFGNCILGCTVIAKTTVLTGKEGFLAAAKLIGEKLHDMLTDKDGIVTDRFRMEDMFSEGIPTTIIVIGGSPKLKHYDMNFGWGKPKKLERVSLDYGAFICIDAGREFDQDLEISVSLTEAQMEDFVRVFNLGLEPYV